MCQRHGGACENCGEVVKELVFGRLCKTCRRFELKNGRLPNKKERQHKAKGWKPCKRCRQNQAYSKGLCVACYDYKRRTGKDRPKEYFTQECLNCGKPLVRHGLGLEPTIHGRGMCQACYQYQWQYGTPRPERLWQHGRYGYCDCGKPATHKATVQVHRHQEEMPLCDECHTEYQRQVAWYGDKPTGNLQQGKRIDLYGDD